MADKSINQLPVSDGLTDDGLLVVYQNSETKSITGKLIKQFAEQGIESALADAKASGEFDGKDGEDGQDGYTPVKGEDYFDGQDGVSPTITVQAITGGHRLTITDATGTKTVDVMDGQDGASGAGSGDMLVTVYDPQGKKQDVFAYADAAVANAVLNGTVWVLAGGITGAVNGSCTVTLYKDGVICAEPAYLVSNVSSAGGEWREHGTSTGNFTGTKTWTFGGSEDGIAWMCLAYKDSTRTELLASCSLTATAHGEKGDAYTLTDIDKNTIAAAVKDSLTTENWTFTLDDGSTVTKKVYVG